MIQKLSIQNFLLIEDKTIELNSGLTVITGESGSGKSLLFKAIRFCFGAKLDRSYIGQWGDSTQVTIWLKSPLGKSILSSVDIPQSDEIEIKQVLREKSRQAWINGVKVSQEVLKKLGGELILDSKQSKAVRLVNSEEQLTIVDTQVNQEVLSQYHSQKQDLVNLGKTYRALESALLVDDEDILRHQVGELENTLDDLPVYDELTAAIEEMKQSQSLMAAWQTESQVLYQATKSARRLEEAASTEGIKALTEELIGSLSGLENEIQGVLSESEKAQYTLDEKKQQLSKINDLARKYRVRPNELHNHYEALKKKLEDYEEAKDQFTTVQKSHQALQLAYEQSQIALDAERSKVATMISDWITPKLILLGMEHAIFQASYQSGKVDFLMQTNPGQLLKPIGQCLSGGELSRLNLLLFVYQGDNRAWMLDEVDSGVSGVAGIKIRDLLRRLGQHRQIVCISHLAQVASGGHQHLLVKKQVSEGVTSSHLAYIDSTERDQELVRLMCGVTPVTTDDAKEMLRSLFSTVDTSYCVAEE